jgi:hypothetical protein
MSEQPKPEPTPQPPKPKSKDPWRSWRPDYLKSRTGNADYVPHGKPSRRTTQ